VHSDNPELRTYAAAMERGQPFIRLKLDIDQPIELGDFVTSLTSIGAEYDRFVRERHPDLAPDATLYVKEVSHGSFIADLIPWAIVGWTTMTSQMGSIMVAEDFVRRYGERLSTYLKPGGRVPDASRSVLKDWSEQMAAVANNPGSKLELAVLEASGPDFAVKTAFKFTTSEAQEIRTRVEEHRREIEHKSGVDHSRVTMTFTRSDIRSSAVGKRSGELVQIDSLSPRSLAVIYASAIAEEQIKHEIAEAEDNVFKKGFVVDVNVEMRNGNPIAYRITSLHQVFDLPDDDD
jgi:hypothetical protein